MPQTLAPVGIYLKQTIWWGKILISSLRPLQCELIGSLSHFHPQNTENISFNLVCKYVFSFWNIWMQQEREVYVWDEPPSSCFLWRSQKSIQQTSKSNE